MRLQLPEKAFARLSIKGFVGAGCIFSRHRVDVSQARRITKKRVYMRDRAGVLHDGDVFHDRWGGYDTSNVDGRIYTFTVDKFFSPRISDFARAFPVAYLVIPLALLRRIK